MDYLICIKIITIIGQEIKMEILLAILIELYLWEDTNGYGLKDKKSNNEKYE